MSIGSSVSLSIDCATDVDTNLIVLDLQAADLGKSIFSRAALSAPLRHTLTISHEIAKSGNERHLIRVDRTEVDALLVPATLGVYLVIDRPISTAITNAVILQTVNNLVDFLIEGGANANVTKVLNNEV